MKKIELIQGCMYSGKSTELLSRLRRAELANKTVVVFKPAMDNRYSDTEVVSHDGKSREAVVVENLDQAMAYVVREEPDVVGFDEAQFFANDMPLYVRAIAHSGSRVIVAGLSSDFQGYPFGNVSRLSGYADDVTTVAAVCMQCGADATKTQRVADGTEVTEGDTYLVGGAESYEARCHHCFVWPTETINSLAHVSKIFSDKI